MLQENSRRSLVKTSMIKFVQMLSTMENYNRQQTSSNLPSRRQYQTGASRRSPKTLHKNPQPHQQHRIPHPPHLSPLQLQLHPPSALPLILPCPVFSPSVTLSYFSPPLFLLLIHSGCTSSECVLSSNPHPVLVGLIATPPSVFILHFIYRFQGSRGEHIRNKLG
jgi:hypothetical protein